MIMHMSILAEEEGHSHHKILKGVYDTPYSPRKRLRVISLMVVTSRVGRTLIFEYFISVLCEFFNY